MTKVESEIEFRGGIFSLEFDEYMKLTVRGSDAPPPSNPDSNLRNSCVPLHAPPIPPAPY